MQHIVISGVGLFTPLESISNYELVDSFNRYVEAFNARHRAAIDSGEISALKPSDEAFIEKASGIKNRYVMNKSGILDIEIMKPLLPARDDDALSVQAEMAVMAAHDALSKAHLKGSDIDAVIVACSNMQRAYPAVAIEVQNALGIEGFAFDMNVACSSATFGLQMAASLVKSGEAKRVLMVNPEICTAHLNFTDRDSHFIFGDACTAVVIESKNSAKTEVLFEILDVRTKTQFSNNIRNNFGYLTKTDPRVVSHPEAIFENANLFMQNGRKVFKDIVPMVSELIATHLSDHKLNIKSVRRLWLHQANANINRLVTEKLLGFTPDDSFAPTILDRYANTSSPGCLIAFYFSHQDFRPEDIGVLCSFGAGYSMGSILIKRI